MKYHQKKTEAEKLFSTWILVLSGAGLLINIITSKLVIAFGLPIYLDTIGSVLVGALGGVIPGMVVGFLSNLIGSITEPISMYYGILSVIIAGLASRFAQKRYFNSIRGGLKVSAIYIFIGGAVGSVMTWLMYGGGIGGIAAPLARFFNRTGLPAFFSQLFADIILDIPDKIITVGVVCLCLKFLPESLKVHFPNYNQTDLSNNRKRKHTINVRITRIILFSVAVTGIVSTTIGTVYHAQRLKAACENMALIVSKQASGCIDGDRIPVFLSEGEAADGYIATKDNLRVIFDNAEEIEYLFVYNVQDDGVHVVFDLDTPDLPGEKPGTVLIDEQGLSSHYEEYINGGEIPIEYSHGDYGYTLTMYSPIFSSDGKIAAYAGIDIDMTPYYKDIAVYIIQTISIIFAIAVLIFIIVQWYVNNHISIHISTIVDQADQLSEISPELWMDSQEWKSRKIIHTGDELEDLYRTVYHMEENASISTKRVIDTEQKLLQTKELQRINEELERSAEMAAKATRAKSDFLSRMSHDMRTPMNGILGMVELSEGETNIEILKQNIMKIKTSGEYLLGLINDTLDFQKIESGNLKLQPEVIDANQMMSNVVDIIKPAAAKKNIDFLIQYDNCDLDWMVRIDPVRIRQIFVNLLSNAIKFTPDGGKVSFKCELLGRDGLISHDRIRISDNGIGMSKEFIHGNIFKPFSQEHNEMTSMYAGTGLGLSIVKSLVELMGGTISVESELGKGTVFTVDIDFERVSKEEVAQIKQAKKELKQTVSSSLSGKRILLAEDHPLNAEIARKLLEKQNCNVTWAKDGIECVKIFIESDEKAFDVILMDIRMPNMNGLEATKSIRKLPRVDAQNIPIIAMTANAYDEDIKKSKEAGLNAHLSKPIDPNTLYKVLSDMIS